jgi:hypothetical protein
MIASLGTVPTVLGLKRLSQGTKALGMLVRVCFASRHTHAYYVPLPFLEVLT